MSVEKAFWEIWASAGMSRGVEGVRVKVNEDMMRLLEGIGLRMVIGAGKFCILVG